jgi:hypothetical protein
MKKKILYDGHVFTREPDSKKWSKRYYIDNNGRVLHRVVWELTNNQKIPWDCCIHHIDYDPDNNSPENLTCVPSRDHLHVYHRLVDSHQRAGGKHGI